MYVCKYIYIYFFFLRVDYESSLRRVAFYIPFRFTAKNRIDNRPLSLPPLGGRIYSIGTRRYESSRVLKIISVSFDGGQASMKFDLFFVFNSFRMVRRILGES